MTEKSADKRISSLFYTQVATTYCLFSMAVATASPPLYKGSGAPSTRSLHGSGDCVAPFLRGSGDPFYMASTWRWRLRRPLSTRGLAPFYMASNNNSWFIQYKENFVLYLKTQNKSRFTFFKLDIFQKPKKCPFYKTCKKFVKR